MNYLQQPKDQSRYQPVRGAGLALLFGLLLALVLIHHVKSL